jgi:hypothetical protein
MRDDVYVAAPSHNETPLSCLRSAGLDLVAERAPGSWRGLTPPGERRVIRVKKFPSKREALSAIVNADRDQRAADYGGGGYAVFGPTKPYDDDYVMSVAFCLRA